MIRKIAFLTLVLANSTAIIAGDNDFYIYGSAGQSSSDRKSEVDATITNLGITDFTSSSNKTDTAFKIQAGYRINQYMAVEGGYINFGKFSYEAASTAPVVATRTGDIKITGMNASLVGSYPISNTIDLQAKVGIISYKLDYVCAGTVIACVNPNRSDTGTPMTYGVAAKWKLGKKWFAQFEHEVFKDVGTKFDATGSNGTTRADVALTSIGFGYQF